MWPQVVPVLMIKRISWIMRFFDLSDPKRTNFRRNKYKHLYRNIDMRRVAYTSISIHILFFVYFDISNYIYTCGKRHLLSTHLPMYIYVYIYIDLSMCMLWFTRKFTYLCPRKLSNGQLCIGRGSDKFGCSLRGAHSYGKPCATTKISAHGGDRNHLYVCITYIWRPFMPILLFLPTNGQTHADAHIKLYMHTNDKTVMHAQAKTPLKYIYIVICTSDILCYKLYIYAQRMK